MATFAKATFNAASYAVGRPTYPARLYETVVKYHLTEGGVPGQTQHALDMGCGTGQATRVLPAYFNRVTGSDPSQVMIDQAKEQTKDVEDSERLDFIVSGAEELPTKVAPASVDLVTAGQAAHWFDHSKVWPALAKIVRPGGTVAYWGYSDFRFAGRSDLVPLITEYAYGPNGVGPYWQQPGRNIVANHLIDIPFPTTPAWDVASARRIHFAGEYMPEVDLPYRPLSDELPSDREYKTDSILSKTMSWSSFEGYLRTWSSLHTYHQHHPEDKAKAGNGKNGDVVDRFIARLQELVPAESFEIVEPLSVMMIKRADV